MPIVGMTAPFRSPPAPAVADHYFLSTHRIDFDSLRDAAKLSDGFVTVGSEDGSSAGRVVRYNNDGTDVWDHKMTGGRVPNAVGVDSSDNIYLVTQAAPGNDYIRKINSAGVVQHERTFTDTSTEFLYGIGVAGNGDHVVVGRIGSSSPFSGAIIKYNSSGVKQFHTYVSVDGASMSVTFFSAHILSDGSIIATGRAQEFGNSGAFKTIATKINGATGAEIWTKFYGTNSTTDERGLESILDSSDDVFIASRNGSVTNITKIDGSTGNILAQTGAPITDAQAFAIDGSGDLYLGKSTGDTILKVSGDLTTLEWSRTLNVNDDLGLTTVGTHAFVFVDSDFIAFGDYTSGNFLAPVTDDDAHATRLPNDGSKTGSYSVTHASGQASSDTFTYAVGSGSLSVTSFTDVTSLFIATHTLNAVTGTDSAGSTAVSDTNGVATVKNVIV